MMKICMRKINRKQKFHCFNEISTMGNYYKLKLNNIYHEFSGKILFTFMSIKLRKIIYRNYVKITRIFLTFLKFNAKIISSF